MLENEIIKWKDLDTQTYVCTDEEAIKLIVDNVGSRLIVALDILVIDNSYIEQIFSYSPIDKSFYNKKYFIITKTLQKEIDQFIKVNNLRSINNTIYKAIALINVELSDWKSFISEDEHFLKQFELITKDEQPLKEALELFNKIDDIMEAQINGEFQYVSFQFSHREAIRVENFWVLKKLMSCLYDHYIFHDNLEIPNELDIIKFKSAPTRLRQQISLGLFDFFKLANKEWYISINDKSYSEIAELFSFAGVKNIDFEVVSTWVKRAKSLIHIIDDKSRDKT